MVNKDPLANKNPWARPLTTDKLRIKSTKIKSINPATQRRHSKYISGLESRYGLNFLQKEDDERGPLKDQPIANADFMAYEQGFEAVEPSVSVFDHGAAGVAFGVKEGVVVDLPIGGAAVAVNVGFNVTRGAGLT